jgi:LysR family hydrogen peroxide-inducible transcriptional activator
MTLNELRYIVVLSAELNFGRAAAKCFVTQPALSAGLKKLEEELGVVIFERGSGKVAVTPIGRLVINHAKQVLDSLDDLKEMVVAAKPRLRQVVRIHCVETVSYALFPAWIPLLRERMPEFPFEIVEDTVHDLHSRQVQGGEVDIAIACYRDGELPLGFTTVYREAFKAVVRGGHPLALTASISLEDLRGWNIVMLNSCYCLHRHLHELLGSAGFMANFTEVNNLQTLLNRVMTGDGVSLLPASVAHKMTAREPLLTTIPLAEEGIKLAVGIFCSQRIREHRWFRDILASLWACCPVGGQVTPFPSL